MGRRWTKAERDARIAAAPPSSFAPPVPKEIEALIAGHVRIAGDPVRSWGKQNLIATCYRVHGEDTLDVIAERYRVTGTVTNLLGDARCLPRRTHRRTDAAPSARPLPPITIQIVSVPRPNQPWMGPYRWPECHSTAVVP